MAHYVVAIEFDGADLPARRGGSRTPVREHAFDLDDQALAHGAEPIRVGFPQPDRGWTSAPSAARCDRCEAAVTQVIRARIHAVVDEAAAVANRTTR